METLTMVVNEKEYIVDIVMVVGVWRLIISDNEAKMTIYNEAIEDMEYKVVTEYVAKVIKILQGYERLQDRNIRMKEEMARYE